SPSPNQRAGQLTAGDLLPSLIGGRTSGVSQPPRMYLCVDNLRLLRWCSKTSPRLGCLRNRRRTRYYVISFKNSKINALSGGFLHKNEADSYMTQKFRDEDNPTFFIIKGESLSWNKSIVTTRFIVEGR